MRLIVFICLLFLSAISFARTTGINNFIVKESLLKNSKIAIIAADSLDKPLENINGTYTFSVSGFTQQLAFPPDNGSWPGMAVRPRLRPASQPLPAR